MHGPGTLLDGRYRVETVLGQGGMGSVYLALLVELQLWVAVKEMHLSRTDPDVRESALRQFRHEAAVLRRLSHPQLPRVHDYFELDGTPYLVMDYIKGRTLSSVVMAEEDPIPEDMVRRWGTELCEVLDYLHRQTPAVVFRDLKPANVMMDTDGRIKLIDFGISKLFDQQKPDVTNTFARGCVSPGFTAPEQYGGGTDARSDIYSLGATLYALLTRTLPVSGVERAADVMTLVPLLDLRPDLTPAFADAIETLMTVKASDRPATIAQARALLERRTLPETVATTRSEWTPPPAEPALLPTLAVIPGRPPRGRRTLVAALVALGLCLGALLAWPVLHHSAPVTPLPTSPAMRDATVSVSTRPDGAKVYVDQVLRGVTPLTLTALQAGRYEVRCTREGFQDTRQDVHVSEGENHRIDIALVPVAHTLQVKVVPGGTQVSLDGQMEGLIGPQLASLAVESGRHRLEFQHDGYRAQTRSVDVGANQPKVFVTVSLAPLPAARPSPSPPAPTPEARRTVVVMPPSSPSPAVAVSIPAVAIDLHDTTIVPGQRVGIFILGTPLKSILDEAGATAREPLPLSDGSFLYRFGRLHVSIRTQNGMISDVFLHGARSAFRTTDGVGLGSSRAEVEKVLGAGQVGDHGRQVRELYPQGIMCVYQGDVVTHILLGPALTVERDFALSVYAEVQQRKARKQ